MGSSYFLSGFALSFARKAGRDFFFQETLLPSVSILVIVVESYATLCTLQVM